MLDFFKTFPTLRWFLTGTLLSHLGIGMNIVTSTWLLYRITGSPKAVGLLWMMTTVGSIFLLPIGGLWLDRFPRKNILISLNVISGFVVAGIITAFHLTGIHALYLYLQTFLLGTMAEIYRVATDAFLRETLEEKDFLKGNGYYTAAIQFGLLGGGALSGILIDGIGEIGVLAVNVATYFLCVGCLYLCPKPAATGLVKPKDQKKQFVKEFSEGIHFIWQSPRLMALTIGMVVLMGIIWGKNVLMGPFSDTTLHWGAKGYGFMDAALGLGSLLAGAIIVPRLALNGSTQRWVGWIVWTALNGLLIPFIPSLIPVLIFNLLVASGETILRSLMTTETFRIVPNHLIGRVSSNIAALTIAFRILIFYSLGVLSEETSPAWGYYVLGILTLILLIPLVLKFFQPQSGKSAEKVYG